MSGSVASRSVVREPVSAEMLVSLTTAQLSHLTHAGRLGASSLPKVAEPIMPVIGRGGGQRFVCRSVKWEAPRNLVLTRI